MFASNTPRTPIELMREAAAMKKATEGDAPLSARKREEAIEKLEAIQAAEDISNATIARILRCSRAVWSQIRHRKYTGDVDRYLRRGLEWMADRLARAEAPAADYVATSIGRKVMKVCGRAWSMPTIGLIVTPSGAGKTAALVEFARRRGDRALYLAAGECICTAQGLIAELALRLHIRSTTRSTTASLYRDIRDRLAEYYAGGKADPFVLLIDEATTLRPSAKNALRNLHDDPACRAAVVLADTGRLSVELHGRTGRAMYEQLRSRSGAQFLMAVDEEISAADVRAVADSVLAAMGHTRKLDRESYRFLHRLAQADGRLRNVAFRLHTVHDVAADVGAAPTYSVAELDFVGDLLGGKCELAHIAPPFATKTAPAGRPAAARVA